MSEPQQQAPPPRVPWAGFKYQPVRGLIDRHISRFLRAQRRQLRRTLRERGQHDLVRQLEELRRDPRRGFMEKNQAFQRVMNEYIARVTPVAGAEAVVGAEAAPMDEQGSVVLPAPVPERLGGAPRGGHQPRGSEGGDVAAGNWEDDGGSVPEVASPDGAGTVIDESAHE